MNDAKMRAFNAQVREGSLRYVCPRCGARKGQPCQSSKGYPTVLHVPRQRIYLRKIGQWVDA